MEDQLGVRLINVEVDVLGAHNASVTTIQLRPGQAARLPNPVAVGPYYAEWWNASAFQARRYDPRVEVIKIVAILPGDALQVERGQGGTTASRKDTEDGSYRLFVGSIVVPLRTEIEQALAFYDWAPTVLDKDLTSPPAEPSHGDRYIVAAGATGEWAGKDGQLAEFYGTIWLYSIPRELYMVGVEDEGEFYVYSSSAWVPWTTFLGTEVVEDVVAGFLTEGHGIDLDYDDLAGTLTVSVVEGDLVLNNMFGTLDTSKLTDGASFIRSGGSVAFAADQSMGSHNLTNVATPTLGHHAVNRDYVTTILEGLDWWESVKTQQNAPPVSPVEGDRHLVGPAPSGVWVGHANNLAVWTSGVWDYVVPDEGTAVWIEGGSQYVYNGSAWVAIGSTVDHGALTGLSDDDHGQYHTDGRADTWLSGKTTTNLGEGTNLYYTDERVDDRVADLVQNGTGLTWTYDDEDGTLTGDVDLGDFDTDDLSEGDNLYYTDDRVDTRVAAFIQDGTGISWVWDEEAKTLTPTVAVPPTIETTDDLDEGETNLYYTDERVDDRVDALLQDAGGISWTYDDDDGTITPATDHASLSSNLGWDDSAHTGTANAFPAFDGDGNPQTIEGAWTQDGVTTSLDWGDRALVEQTTSNLTYTAGGDVSFASTAGNMYFTVAGENHLCVFEDLVQVDGWLRFLERTQAPTASEGATYLFMLTNEEDTLRITGSGGLTKKVQDCVEKCWYADQFEDVDADWGVSTGATIQKDTIEGNLVEARFIYATETAVGLSLQVPTWATRIKFKFMHHTETSPGGSPSSWTPRYYVRTLSDGGDWSAWSAAVDMTALTLPASTTNWNFDEQTVTLATLGITAGQEAQITISRKASTGLNAVVGLRRACLEVS